MITRIHSPFDLFTSLLTLCTLRNNSLRLLPILTEVTISLTPLLTNRFLLAPLESRRSGVAEPRKGRFRRIKGGTILKQGLEIEFVGS